MTSSLVITPFVHQQQIINAVSVYRDIDWFILAGGYGCGKSFSIVLSVLDIVRRYNGKNVSVGIGSITITLAKKTIWKDLEIILKQSSSSYSFNQQDNILTIGTVQFFFIAIEQPSDVYAYNLNIFLCDEIDELSQGKAVEANKAIRERTRLVLPDGRIPYIMYFTTVQGYRGLYQIVQTLRKSRQRYVLVRGLTKDNTSLAPSYVRSLYAIYDDNERLAYLEGRFVNLRAGRVYPEYDEGRCTCEDIDVREDDVVYIGQDLNTGFSKGVALVKRDKTLHIVHTWSFIDIGSAPAIMRKTFPRNKILWFPDASGKSILKGYTKEIAEQGIDLRIGTVNPSIVDRIFYVNKLFKLGRLQVCKSKTEQLTEALKTRQYSDTGMPEKGKGELAPDHICDALEYVIYRLVRSDSDFFNLKEISREEIKKNGYI